MSYQRSMLIVGSDRQWEEDQLVLEAEHAGCEAEFIPAASVLVAVAGGEADLSVHGKSFRERFRQSAILFRRSRGAEDVMGTLALLARHWEIPMSDSPLSILTNIDKSLSLPPLTLHELRHIQTTFVRTDDIDSAASFPHALPLVIKPARGRHGEGVQILRTPEDLQRALAAMEEDMLLQEYLPIEEEFRVFVVGQRSLGVVRKIPPEGSVVANYAAGARFIAAELPETIEQEAVAVCQEQEIDIGGVDIARVGDRYYLLEVNRCPEFKAFTAATQVNVAQAMIEFLLQKSACSS